MSTFIFSSESVGEGHPDKVCDTISDAILDACLKVDKTSRVACETFVKSNHVIVGGEITTTAWVDLEEIIRKVITGIGYDSSEVGFDGNSCAVVNMIGKQSPDINQGVDRASPAWRAACSSVQSRALRKSRTRAPRSTGAPCSSVPDSRAIRISDLGS